MRLATVVASAAVLLASAAVAQAADIHVPGDYRRLGDALDAAQPGDRILVGRGTFKGGFVLSTPGVEVVGGPRTRLVGVRGTNTEQGWPALWITGAGCSVRNVQFDKGGVVVQADGVTVENCEFRRFRDPGGATGRVLDATGDGVVVSGCRILKDAVAFTGITVTGDGAVVVGNEMDAKQVLRGIVVTGDGATVGDNDVDQGRLNLDQFNPDGIVVVGSEGTIESNRLEACHLGLCGDGNLVLGNEVRDAYLGRPAFQIEGDGNVVADNAVVDAADTGILVIGDFNTLGDDVFAALPGPEGGASWGHGIVARGSGNTVVDGTVEGCGGDAFRVVGNGGGAWQFDGALVGWIWVETVAGEGNDVDGCVGADAVGCGIANWTGGTSVNDSIFTDNGVDVVDGGGFDVFEGNTWGTGGPGFAGNGQGADIGDTTMGNAWDITGGPGAFGSD